MSIVRGASIATSSASPSAATGLPSSGWPTSRSAVGLASRTTPSWYAEMHSFAVSDVQGSGRSLPALAGGGSDLRDTRGGTRKARF